MSNISRSESWNFISGSDITGESTYDIWKRLGFEGEYQEFLDFMRTGIAGKSAYDLWLEQGNTGSVEDFFASLKGEKGDQGVQGEQGIEGKSAYQTWLDLGNEGTEEDFIASLQGASGFPETTTDDNLKVLTVNAEGNTEYRYPMIMDGTLTKGYQQVTNSSGKKQELFVIDIANPMIGIFYMHPDYWSHVRIINGTTILYSAKGVGAGVKHIEVVHADTSYVEINVVSNNGATGRYIYTVETNTWEIENSVYHASQVDKLLENKISFDNETEYAPTEDYHPATKKYVDESKDIATDEEVLNVLMELELVDPVTSSSGALFTSNDGKVYSL